jgi:hypothetical protein
LVNPTAAEQLEFLEMSGKAADSLSMWSGLYETDQETLIGVVKIIKSTDKIATLIIKNFD